MDSRYGIHTIELFHRMSKKDFNKVFQHLKSVNSGNFYPDTTYHSEKGLTKYICTSYCGQGVVLSIPAGAQQEQNKEKSRLFYTFPSQSAHFAARRIFAQEGIPSESGSVKIA